MVIIWTNYDGPASQMLHTKPQGNWPFGSGEEDFWRDFTIYGRGDHLGHVTQTPRINYRSLILLRLHIKFGFDSQVVFEKKIFENGGRRTDDDGRTTDHGYNISSPVSVKAKVR